MGNQSDNKLEWNGENYIVLRFLVPALQHVEIWRGKKKIVLLSNRIGGGSGFLKTTAVNIDSEWFSKNSLNYSQSSHQYLEHTCIPYRKLPGCSMAVPMERRWRKENTRVIIAKTVMTVDCLTAKVKPRSLWNWDTFCDRESAKLATSL